MSYAEPQKIKVLDREVVEDIRRLKSLKNQLESCCIRIDRYQSYGSQYYLTGKPKLKNALLSGERYEKYVTSVGSFVSDFESRQEDIKKNRNDLNKILGEIESKLQVLETRKYRYEERSTL